MMPIMIDEKLLAICAQLAKQGKKPSVGLLKGRAPSSYPLPQIIAAVQYWKANPKLQGVKAENLVLAKDESMASEKATSLEERVAYLETKVAQLEQQLSKLSHLN